MPLQNRVDPFGAIHAVVDRGLFTGNRGIIHDPGTRTLLQRRWTTRAWITCDCDFGARKRVPMGLNRVAGGAPRAGWTELFFLDEVTALSAGHRPCFYCRRGRAQDFLMRFGEACVLTSPRAPMLDLRLHGERLAAGAKPLAVAGRDIANLPDGAMVSWNGKAYAVRSGALLPWHFGGYASPIEFASAPEHGASIVTPATTLAILRQGYRPVWHDSAAGALSQRRSS